MLNTMSEISQERFSEACGGECGPVHLDELLRQTDTRLLQLALLWASLVSLLLSIRTWESSIEKQSEGVSGVLSPGEGG